MEIKLLTGSDVTTQAESTLLLPMDHATLPLIGCKGNCH